MVQTQVRVKRGLLDELTDLPPQKLVVHQLAVVGWAGDLRNYPLVALIIRPVQDVSVHDQSWIEALRDWCFIQFLSAIYSKTEPTQYLIDVASKLRLGIDKDTDWLDTFVRLRGSTSSFTELTRHLGASAKNLLDDTKHPIDLPSHRKLLETLRNFCQGKSPTSEANPTASAGGGLFKRYLDLPASQRRPPELLPSSLPTHETQDNLDAQDLGIECFDADDADEDVNQVAGVDENDTPASQEIKVKQVLLSSVEDYQFLPFSWNRPNAYERHALNQWFEQAWPGQDLGTLKIATLLFAAIQTGNSLRTVLTSRLTKDSSDDWSVDIDGSCLHRRPPRRYAGWRSTQETDAWVSPRVEQLRIALPSAATAVLAQLHRKVPEATNLLELWFAQPPPEQQFHAICRSIPALHRVTSGMLAYWLEQESFETSADPVLSHLLASRPISGLPGSCAYSSYPLATVRSAIRVVAAPLTPTSDAQDLLQADHINPHKVGVSILLSHIRVERWTQLIGWAGSAVSPPFDQLTSRALLESALKMIGPSRQILLYRQLHFDLLRQITKIWGLQNSDFRLVSPQTPHPMLQKWAPRDLQIEVVGSDKKSTKLQIDAVEDVYLPMLPKHRCAVLPIVSGEPLIHDSFEWVALVAVSLFLMTSLHSVNRSGFGSSASIETNS